MNKSNGTTKDVTLRNNQGHSSDQSGGLGVLRQFSEGHEYNEVGTNQKNCSGGNSFGTNSFYGDTPLGKLLQRLQLVEQSYKAYVRADQERLKARLDESKQLEELFEQSVAELRQEIYQLATEENPVNGNGHIN